jgi:L-2-hydroxyglutarate oxidase LhgO
VDQVDCVIVGAGVVGLAIARAVALSGREVIVLERQNAIGMGTSSRNSEVIHAGIYYKPGSLKAKLCVAGRDALYKYCADNDIPHRNCSKLIVACSADETLKLEAIAATAHANGVLDLRMISAAEAKQLEPDINCEAALLSPSTGIIDSHSYMLSLRGQAESTGAMFAFAAPLMSARAADDGLELDVGGAEPMQLRCKTLINAAGLHAPKLAQSIEGLPKHLIPEPFFAKGSYFSTTVRPPFSRLIYPAPVSGALGIHLTFDLAGDARFGPDIEWLSGVSEDTLDYRVNPQRGEAFYAAIRTYWPALPDGALSPAYSGVRPKIVPRGAPDQDFIIQDSSVHGIPGLINLFGIESPGLTSSLALADRVCTLV